jgi:hypothetical protein
MIIKGVTIRIPTENGENEPSWTLKYGCEIDIPATALRELIREEIKLEKVGMIRLPDEPEERSCETCGWAEGEISCGRRKRGMHCSGLNNWEPKPPATAPEDAMASEWRKGNDAIASGDLSKIITAFFDLNKVAETAIAEEQARTKRVTKILEDHGPDGRNCTNQQFVDIRRRLEEAELKLADAWTDEDMRLAFRVGWNYNDHVVIMRRCRKSLIYGSSLSGKLGRLDLNNYFI